MSQELNKIPLKSILLGVVIGISVGVFLTLGGNQPPTTCDEIKVILTKNLKGEIELSNKDFKMYVESMIWCKEVQKDNLESGSGKQ